MKKIRIMVIVIALTVCIQSLATVTAFADTTEESTAAATQTEETAATNQTEAAVTETEAVETDAQENEVVETTNEEATATIEVETVELNLLQTGSIDPTDYDVNITKTVKQEVAAEEIEIKAAPSASLEDYIATKMDTYATRIDISGYGIASSDASKSKVFKAITNAVNNNPRLFYVGNTMRIGSGAGKVLAVYPDYTMKSSTANQQKALFDKEVNKALATVKSTMSASTKAKAIHDYLAKSAEYDIVNYKKNTIPINSYRANGVLIKKIGVCQSYAMAYKYIMEDKLGIPTTYASTSTHIWNMVKISGKYYNVDVTWDDGGKKKVGYTYFLVGKNTMTGAHKGKRVEFYAASSAVAYGAPAKMSLTKVKAGKRKATATWKKNTTVTGYQVYYSTKKTTGFKKAKTIGNKNTASFTKKSLKKGKTYYFKVRAYSKVNGKTLYGSFSKVKAVKIK